MYRFDMNAFFAAVDQKRCERRLTWKELTTEVNRPFQYTTSIPIRMSTIRGMQTKHSVTSAVVLQLLRWLGRSPEEFLAGRKQPPSAEERLPEAAAHQILRFDTQALFEALDRQRRERGMTWKEVAGALPGFTPGMLTNLAGAPLIGFPRVMFLTQWLRQPASVFVRCCER